MLVDRPRIRRTFVTIGDIGFVTAIVGTGAMTTDYFAIGVLIVLALWAGTMMILFLRAKF
jgi:hypothetical protein